MGPARHLRTLSEVAAERVAALLDDADVLRSGRSLGVGGEALRGCSVGLLFEKPSTRTWTSLQVAVAELGGTPVALPAGQLQLGRGETVADTARTLSAYLHAVCVRTSAHTTLDELVEAGSVPVINALSDAAHPLQALADLLTLRDELGDLAGRRVAYLGDGNNVARSLMRAGAMTGMSVTVAGPEPLAPPDGVVGEVRELARHTGARIEVIDDADAACRDADAVYTDVWTSMGQEGEEADRRELLAGYRLDARRMALAADHAVALHCLPAHRGEEIAAEVLDGPASRVWQQAANRLHTAKAVLRWALGADEADRGASGSDDAAARHG